MVVRFSGSAVLLFGLAILFPISTNIWESRLDENQRKELWKQVEQAEKKALPKSAIEVLDKIYQSAIADNDYPEAVHALTKKYSIEGSINQPIAPYVIRKLGAEMDGLPNEVQPVMKVILANWFFSYYQQNRWRFAQRSQTGQVPSEDFETWDLPRLLSEIDKLYADALANSEKLKKIPINTYNDLLVQGNVSDLHRPTLFDFVAYQALEFYSLDEQIIRKQGAFDLRADSPVFSSSEDFLQWQPAPDDTSFLVHATKLLQDLLSFHADDEDPTARLDANLYRLRFGYLVAVGPEKTARYKAALRRFDDQHNQHPLSSSALAALAGVLHGENQWVKAHELASTGYERFPESAGGKQCFNLVQQIESPELNVETERVWNSAKPVLNVKYRNLDQIHLRLVKFDYRNWRWGELNRPENVRGDLRKKILSEKPIRQWEHKLPDTDDYQRRLEPVPLNVDMPSGCYLLLASMKDDFSEGDNVISISEVWASELAVVLRHEHSSTKVSAHVLKAVSGEPVAGASVEVSAWIRDGRNSRSVDLDSAKTDESGFFSIQGRPQYYHRIIVKHGDQIFGCIDHSYKYANQRNNRPTKQTVFFTDRSIYRPGQTVKFKGICIFSDTNSNDYKILPNQSVVVSLKDVNNEEVEKLSVRTNEFGSFSGSITAPSDRATGQMRIEAVGNGLTGAGFFRVEEYKRPKFFVEVEKPEKGFQLNETVSIPGSAKSYTGAPVDGAKVTWRVVRNVRFPDWWMWRCWWCPPVIGEPQEISNGETQTDINGSFELEFDALPDLAVERESEPVFSYTIYADVTDTTGETRSSNQVVRIGYTSLQASISCDKWQTADEPVSLTLKTTTLDGEGQACDGSLKIYRLDQPENVHRAEMQGVSRPFNNSILQQKPDLSRIKSWPLGDVVSESQITTDANGELRSDAKLAAGAYKAVFETKDKSGQKVTAEFPLLVVDLDSKSFATRIPNHFQAKTWKVEAGEEFVAVWGSGYERGRAFIEIEHRGDVIKSFWTDPDTTQSVIRHDVSERLRGGFFVRATYVRENRAYTENRRVDVPWSNKKLAIRWEHFVSKLQPGGKETWSAIISGPNAELRAAEMVATLYDASLDAFASHNWPESFNVFYQDRSQLNLIFQNSARNLQHFSNGLRMAFKDGSVVYRHFPYGLVPNVARGLFSRNAGIGGGFGGGRGQRLGRTRKATSFAMEMMPQSAVADEALASGGLDQSDAPAGELGEQAGGSQPVDDVDLSNVSARKNLQETAFFFPNLTVDANGAVRIEFEIPEALTKWKFMGFAHDNDLRTALLQDEAVTSKDLMVQPNPPRFLREGDMLEFSVKVSNQSATQQSGKVRLSFADARNDSSMDPALSNDEPDRMFDIPAGQSKSIYWKLKVPDFVGVLTYKAVGGTKRISDGEEGLLPVLSKRILVTESLPLPIRGNQDRKFTFDRLKKSGESDSLQSQSLTVQMTSNPSWYAVMALPYLMEYPHQCSEQVFNRLYANSLGQFIVNSDPKIERVFEQWRGTDALDSPLEKNDDIRNVLIAESPWLRDAKAESVARRNVAVMFDSNRLSAEIRRALNQLTQMQYSDGAWPWFPGGKANDYITLYVTTGFGRLRHLGVKIDTAPAIKSLDRLDSWVNRTYQKIVEDGDKDLNHLSPTICLYLYGRSFFLNDKGIDPKHKAAVDYFLEQAKRFWPELRNRQSQGHLAIALKRFLDLETPVSIMKSLTERSQSDDELGMFWREANASWWWYRAPIETQALMIEAYDEVMGDMEKVEECKIWLLKQKQTQNWKTTKATADAVYSLLLRGSNLLASDNLVDVKLGDLQIQPEDVESGTGFYQQRFVRDEIKPEMGDIHVSKHDKGIAWGSVHWQYLEEVGKIEPYEGTPLKLKKALFVKKNTDHGPAIEPVNGPVAVGDELVTRVELRVDRDMEYVHLKDYRGSGTEPVNVLSSYKFQDGLSYYESTKDTASHFFIDYLPRGTYVFEYSVRVQHRGKYETGIAELQCMYAPEYNSHSGSLEIIVQ